MIEKMYMLKRRIGSYLMRIGLKLFSDTESTELLKININNNIHFRRSLSIAPTDVQPLSDIQMDCILNVIANEHAIREEQEFPKTRRKDYYVENWL